MNAKTQKTDNDSPTASERRQKRFVVLSEATMVAACMLVFFGFLSLLIRAFFPQGTSLIVDPDSNILADASWSGEVELGIKSEGGDVSTLFAGEILNIQRNVKHRGANTLTWKEANVGGKIVRNDAVQTFARSTAMMAINNNSRLTIGENSLIVFDQREADPFLADSSTVLVMIDGELSGTLSGADKSRFRFGVTLPNSEVTL